ncbi:MAG: protein kinase [Acidobacteriota bacterium]
MATCPECGSEVAGIDIFCPYCGITLQPTEVDAPASPESDESMASTIMIPTFDRAALVAEAKAARLTDEPASENAAANAVEANSPEISPAAEFDEEVQDVPSTVEEDAEPSAASGGASADLPGIDDIPVPDILAGHGVTSDNIPKSTSEYNFNTSAEPIAAPVESEPAPESSQPPESELFRERLTTPDSGIGKPSIELESPPSNTAFDSVRIMEPRPAGQEDVDTRIQGMPAVHSSPLPVAAEEPPVPISEPAETGSNIGRVDTDGRRSAKLKPLTEGTVLNARYEIVRKIGGGGMGAVYLASDNNLGGVLRAVKEMVQSHIDEEHQEKSINDFKRESMILSTLDHASIPTIYDYFYDEFEGRFYLVMKYISGGDLAARLRAAPTGKIDELLVTEWAVQIADVLDYLHNQPSTIVYRDLKPSNIMIDGNTGRIMLIDFGIARSIGQKEEKGVTAVGTMGYAPPELFSGNVEPRSDIYSLGSTMFHLLTGADPQSNPLLIFDFQKNPRPRQINPQLSDQIERILMRAVEYNSDARFASAGEMRQALEDHLANLKSGKLSFGVSEAPASVSLSNQAVFCGFCGQRIVATDMFCAFCGSKQPLAQHGVHSEIYSSPSVTAKLVVEGTSELSTPAFALQKDENLLGRRDPMSNIFPEVDLSKYDPQTKISRRHARIWRDGNNFLVEDLGSSNGTILAPQFKDSFRLPPMKPHALSHGDKIKIGDTTLHFVIG